MKRRIDINRNIQVFNPFNPSCIFSSASYRDNACIIEDAIIDKRFGSLLHTGYSVTRRIQSPQKSNRTLYCITLLYDFGGVVEEVHT